MADVDTEAAAEEQAKPARPAKAKKPGGGGPMTAVLGAVALAAIVLAVFLFMQLQGLKSQLTAAEDPQPRGTNGAHAAGGAGEDGADHYAWQDDPLEVIYHLGEFQTNTSDGRHAKMDISLVVVSGYSTTDRAVYESEMQMYERDLAEYLEALGASSASAANRPRPTGGVLLAGFVPARGRPAVLAQHGAPAPEPEPLEPPVEPTAPVTVLEKRLEEIQPQVRDLIIDQINVQSAAALITPEGKTQFKQAVVDGLNNLIDRYYGTVKDILFNEFVTT